MITKRQDDGPGTGTQGAAARDPGPAQQPPGSWFRDHHPAFWVSSGHHPGHLAIILAIILADYAIILPTRMICMPSSYLLG